MVRILHDGTGCISLPFYQHYYRHELVCTLDKIQIVWRGSNILTSHWSIWFRFIRGTPIPHYWMDQANNLDDHHSCWCNVVTSILFTNRKCFPVLYWSDLGYHWWVWRTCWMQRCTIRKSNIPLSSNRNPYHVPNLGVPSNGNLQNKWLPLQTRWRRWLRQLNLWFLDP